MNVFLLTPVHNEFVNRSTKKIHGIPITQGQASWVKAILKLHNKVDVFIYSSSVILPQMSHAGLIYFFNKYFPIFTGRIRRRIEKYFYLNPEVYVKSMLLEKRADKFAPDVICISGGVASILPITIGKIKKKHKAKVLLFSGVNPSSSSTVIEKILIQNNTIDYVIENDSGYANQWKKLGAHAMVLPISSVDPERHKKIKLTKREKDEYSCDISFVGSITQDRIEKLKVFEKFNFKFWGDVKPGVEVPPDLLPFYQGLANSEKMIKIFNASKIVVNLQPRDTKVGGNMRTFEICGSGAFQLADKVEKNWFEIGVEIVIFKDMKDAVSKISYYLSHENERRKIAENGYKRAHKDHTYVKHFEKLFSQI